MKFSTQYLDGLSIKCIHNPPHLSYVSTLPAITQIPKSVRFCSAHGCGETAEKFVKLLLTKMSPKHLSPKRVVAQVSVAQTSCCPKGLLLK